MSYAAINEISACDKLLGKLNEAQYEAATHYEGAYAIIAAPGAGKTASMVARASYMISSGVDPNSMLMFTFTKKGANEIEDRIVKNIGIAATGLTISTYHSFCCKVLRRYASYLGWTKHFTIYDDDDRIATITELIKGVDDLKPQIVASKISHYKDQMISPYCATEQADSDNERIIADIYSRYEMAKKAMNVFDFDDLIYFAIRLFEQFPETIKTINHRIKYIIADEAQDSSPRDLLLIQYLGGSSFNVCICLDDDQSIYGFRGSDISAVAEFVKKHNMKIYILGQNYRSTQTIVKSARNVIGFNKQFFEKTVFTENKEGGKISIVPRDSEQKEASAVSTIVKRAIRQGYNYKDIGILYRMSRLSMNVEKSFLSRNIPYRVQSGTPFYSREEIKDILSYINVAVNDVNQVAFERVINKPSRGLGTKALDQIYALQDALSCDIMTPASIIDTCSHIINNDYKVKGFTGKKKESLKQFIAIINTIKDDISNKTPVKDIIKDIISLTNYYDYLTKHDGEHADDKISNLEELINIASSYTDVFDFLNNMSLNEAQSELQDSDNSDNKVTLMTMHASKGLEFPIVIIVGAVEGTSPHWLAIKSGEVDEERRLFYVAMTRAKEKLYITYPKIVCIRGTVKTAEPSRFIQEIKDKYIQVI